jgi:hypothetical protein
MELNATFNNISVISWRSVVLVEETGVLGENHRHVAMILRWKRSRIKRKTTNTTLSLEETMKT